jgi:hypothetical protein
MTIVEGIRLLKHILKEYGDLEITTVTDVGGQYFIQWDKIFDVVTFPEKNKPPVCALMYEIKEDKPDLKLVN